jgi:hypothetical protein
MWRRRAEAEHGTGNYAAGSTRREGIKIECLLAKHAQPKNITYVNPSIQPSLNAGGLLV